MSRRSLLWVPIGLLVVAAGCTMCANTYDECGPTFTAGCSQQCRSTARAGSILSDGPSLAEEPVLAPEAASAAGGANVPGKVMTITDRKVEGPTAAPRSAGEPSGPETGGWKSRSGVRVPSAPTTTLEN